MSWNAVLVLVLIVLSGFADSLGFVYAAKIWKAGVVSWPDFGRAWAGWAVGITLYVISLKYMARLGVTSAEIQTSSVVRDDDHRRRDLQRPLLQLAASRADRRDAGARRSWLVARAHR